MRKILFIALTLLSFPALACEEAKNAISELEQTIASNGATHTPQPVTPVVESVPFREAISNEAAVRDFAANSTFGGGRIFETDFHDERLLIVYRGYTSGVKSSDIGVYAERNGQWVLVKSHPVVMNTWIEAVNNGKDLIFHPENNPKPVMILTQTDLPPE